MKLTHLLQFALCLMLFSCTGTKNIKDHVSDQDNTILEDSDEDGIADVIDMPIEHDVQATQTLSIVSYFIKKVNDQGKPTYSEQAVEGTAVFETNGDRELMIITEDLTKNTITCEKQLHAVTRAEIFVEIGGESEEREH